MKRSILTVTIGVFTLALALTLALDANGTTSSRSAKVLAHGDEDSDCGELSEQFELFVSEHEAEGDHHMDDDHGDDHSDDHADDNHDDDDHADDYAEDHDDADTHDHSNGTMHVHEDVPDSFAGLGNPLMLDMDVLVSGCEVFQTTCAACHGESGQGDSPSTQAFDPPAPNLVDPNFMAGVADDYLFWRIAEGGQVEPFDSSMPAFGETLEEDERWSVIYFLRALAHNDSDHAHDDEHDS